MADLDADDTLIGPPLQLQSSGTDQTLAAEDQPHSDTKRTAPGRLTELMRKSSQPTELGHYVLLEKLGEGGMGVVFAAYDKRLDRKVAIKLLRSSSGDVQVRLIREAQAMARLSHPNVVQIYEIGELRELDELAPMQAGGSDKAPVFMVMEFVDGVTLGAWQEQRTRSIPELLAVFGAAGRGLAAAHGKGLVHRDFKPDNVMIRSDGRVVVMDFGLAREGGDGWEPSGAISLGALMAESALDGRSSELSTDLTATGAMMGTPAYMSPEQFRGDPSDAKSDQFSFCVALWEALHGERPFRGDSVAAIAFAVLQDKRTAPSGNVPTWLQRTIERGLAHAPGDRWPSMDALLAALAADPTRRRRGWIAGFAVAGVLLAGVAGARLLDARREAQTRQTCADEAQAIATAWNAERAEQLSQRFDDPALADAWSHARGWMDDYVAGWSALHERSCIEATVDETRTLEQHQRVLACLDDDRLAVEAMVETWTNAEAREVAHAATAAAELPPISLCENQAWLAQRVQPPEDPELRERVTSLRAELERAEALGLIGEYEAGLQRAEQALREAETLAWTPLVAEATLCVAELQHELGSLAESRASFERASVLATASATDLVALRAATRLTSIVGYELSDQDTGKYWGSLAEALLTRVGLAETLHDAALRAAFGDVQWAASDYPSALASYQAAFELYRSALGPRHPQVARQLDNVGYLHMEQGDYDRAIAMFEEARQLSEAALGPNHPNIGDSLSYMGDAYAQRGEYQKAIESHERALALFERALGPMHPRVADALNNLGVGYSHLGDEDQALAMYERAYVVLESAYGSDHPALATALNNIATVQARRKDYEAALVNYRLALELDVKHRGPDHKHAAVAHNNMGSAYAYLGQHRAALDEYALALEIFEAKLGPDHPNVAHVLIGIGRSQRELGELAAARATLERGQRILAGSGGRAVPNVQYELALLLAAEGHPSEARAMAEQALAGYEALGLGGADEAERTRAWLAAQDLEPK